MKELVFFLFAFGLVCSSGCVKTKKPRSLTSSEKEAVARLEESKGVENVRIDETYGDVRLEFEGTNSQFEAIIPELAKLDVRHVWATIDQMSLTSLNAIADMNELRILSLQGSSFNEDVDFGILSNSKHLGELDLSFSLLEDKHIKNLSELKQIDTLCVHETQITNDSYETLSKMKKLNTLIVGMWRGEVSTGIDEVTISRLQKVLPKTSVNPDTGSGDYEK